MPYEALIVAILALPIAGFAFTALFGRRIQARYGRNAVDAVPVLVVVLSWLAAMVVVAPALAHAEPFGELGLRLHPLPVDPGRELRRRRRASTSTR